tara:strand:+ start:2663 stop:4201 length:1539 start_codon:yes stop_codon:yes gene_type:complete
MSMVNFNLQKEQSSIIKVIGVGGGGSNAVNHMYNQGISGVDFVICNTDQQALDLSPIPNKIQLGATLTEGRGAGSNPEVGKNSAIENVDELKELFANNTQMVFITAGMGGGTGTGAAPIIAQTAREMGILTVGIVTIPFSFEGRRRKIQADEGLEALRQNVDTMLIICNDKLREMYGNLKMSEAFSKADDILTVAAKGIAEIITVAGYINVDFEDVKTVMKDGGTAIMGSASAEGNDRAITAVTKAMSSPLLNDNEIKGAKYILLNITSGEDEISMDEIDAITDYIQEEAGNSADIIWGNGIDESLGNKVSVTIVATGFGSKSAIDLSANSQEPKKIVRNLQDEVKTNITQKVAGEEEKKADKEDKPAANEPFLKSSENQVSFEFEIKKNESKPEPEVKNEPEVIRHTLEEDIEEASDDSMESFKRKSMSDEEQMRRAQERVLKLKSMNLKMKTPGGINDLENEPAYKRRNIRLDSTPHSSESNVSRYTLSEDDDKKTTLRPNNSFLHDNVD